MKYYTSLTEYNAGVDLHSRNLYLCVMDRAGKVLVHEDIRNNDLEHLKRLIKPYRHDLTLAFESCFMRRKPLFREIANSATWSCRTNGCVISGNGMRDAGLGFQVSGVSGAHRLHLSLRTPRSGAFVAIFVVSQIDIARDKARDKVFGLPENVSDGHLKPET